MKFKDKDSGREYTLKSIKGSDFWADRDGDLYITEDSGYCVAVSGQTALEAILKRENGKTVIHVVCHQNTPESSRGGFLGHTENYLKNYVDKR